MSRNDDEFEEFVAARFLQLRRVSYLIVRDWQQAEDIVQSTLIKVYSAWGRLQRRASLEAYTRRAVVNASISWVRKPRRELLTDRLPDTPVDDTHAGLDDEWTSALALATPAQAAIIALRFLDDLSVHDVAELLGISEGTVKSQTSRGLAKVKQALQPSALRRSAHE